MAEDESVLSRPAGPPDAVIAWGTSADQVADIRHGGETAAARPLLAIVHGGFWRPRYDRAHTAPMAAALAAAGWTVASLEYRRIPGQPDASVGDVGEALRVLPDQVAGHDGRVIAIGHSAGGHLVLLAAARPPSPSLCGVLALAPVADLRLADRMNLGDGAVRAFLSAAPETRADLDPVRLPSPAVPTTLLQGEEDETVPPAIGMSYRKTHPQTGWIALPGCAHFAPIDPLSAAWPAVVAQLERLAAG